LIIRNATATELESYAQISDDPVRNRNYLGYVKVMLREGYTNPGWLFVAEAGGKVVARAGYWSLPHFQQPQLLDLLILPWAGDYLAVGSQLLQESLTALHERGAERLGFELDFVPGDPAAARERNQQAIITAEAVGFQPSRQTLRFELTDMHAPISLPSRLTFRNLTTMGEEAFITAIARVSEGSLDRNVQASRAQLGARAAAGEHFMGMQGFKHEPGWWQLAYLPDGDLAGLVMPARNDGGPIIAYIGVVPEQRGKGYVDDLLAKGTAILAASGAWRIRADTDTQNAPMAAAFRRAGYKGFARRHEYTIRLPHDLR